MALQDGSSNDRPLRAWEKNLLGVRVDQVPGLMPGLILVALLAGLSIWLSEYSGTQLLGFDKTPISPVMVAILLGILLGSLLRLPDVIRPGLSFSVKKVLRIGIILLGIRLTIFDVFKLGLFGVPIVILCILSALLITGAINRALGSPAQIGHVDRNWDSHLWRVCDCGNRTGDRR